ncbi:Kinesin-related protein 3 [Phytophthora nicotianae]|uniref:RNA-dependent RNA polymerase n=1 Tax=Phytophthora nicotianae TaxID=4792 RepID=A0A0W8DI36_PHYNI|nr:Kinesin-related protein 3 [Phytophthora nicotianae]
MTITPDEAWSLACRRCDALVARHSQLSFILENATGVHLTLDKTLLHNEQLGESWRVSSHSGVLPALQFTKIRTKNAFKRQRLPFELCCVHCDAKVASEDLSQLTSPAKYLKRLGQAFSSTKETFEVNQSVLDNPVEDIENDQYVFTDGCGEIALVGAENIVRELQLPFTPSAFQIRLGGAKGVLVVSDLGRSNIRCDDAVVLRKSMSKFTSNHRVLEIVAFAGKSEAYLTRQSVLILNDLGINEDVFMEMQEEFLSDLRSLIASDDGAYFELKAVLPPSVIWWIDVLVRKLEVKILADEYLSSLARTIYHYRLANTVMRARIPIAKGRTLMGVADFTGTLEYGEVFVQYSETDEEIGTDSYVVLDDVDVAVHRSPCHHPGDIRVLRCRADVPPQLRQLKDCIVFPSKGPRPHPEECTGGDLDGDMFVVIWDKRLIPSRAQVHEPMAFDEDTGGDTSPEERNTTSQRMTQVWLIFTFTPSRTIFLVLLRTLTLRFAIHRMMEASMKTRKFWHVSVPNKLTVFVLKKILRLYAT